MFLIIAKSDLELFRAQVSQIEIEIIGFQACTYLAYKTFLNSIPYLIMNFNILRAMHHLTQNFYASLYLPSLELEEEKSLKALLKNIILFKHNKQ